MTKKILIVDDEPDLLDVTTFRLKKNGYHVLTAIDGQAALTIIEKEMPDLVLLDLRLPVMNGQEVCKKIKADPKLKNIAVIIFTASAGGDVAQKVKALGADDYLIKPFDSEEMLDKIANLLN